MTLREHILHLQETLLCFSRKWWRPICCWQLPGALFVNMVYLPIHRDQPIEFSSASVFVGSIVAAFAVREWGKAKGTAA